MTRDLWRLMVICFAWSVGVVLVWLMDAGGLSSIVPAIFAAAAYVLTRDTYGPGRGGGGGNVKYWRGRRIDDRDRGRWNAL